MKLKNKLIDNFNSDITCFIFNSKEEEEKEIKKFIEKNRLYTVYSRYYDEVITENKKYPKFVGIRVTKEKIKNVVSSFYSPVFSFIDEIELECLYNIKLEKYLKN